MSYKLQIGCSVSTTNRKLVSMNFVKILYLEGLSIHFSDHRLKKEEFIFRFFYIQFWRF